MSKGNILIVDDTLINLELLETVLDDAGYDARTATSGEMAIKSIEKHMPDLILLDIMMPGIDGYETCELIKKNPLFRDIPIIFISAKNETIDKVTGINLGAVDYISKPFDISEVLVRIKSHLSLSFLQKTLERKMSIIDKNVITFSTDLNDLITDVSEALCKVSGYSKEELIGNKHDILRHPDMKNEVYLDLWETLQDQKTWQGEMRNIAKDGTSYYVECIISPTKDINENLIGYSYIIHDITDKKRIESLAITDQLTNLHNRRYFNDTFPIEIKRAIRKKSLLSFAMLDVDYFKQYNDTYGHQKGDTVLSLIGKTLKSTLLRPEDFIFRLGGEEFGLIFSTDTFHSAELIAQEVRKSVQDLGIEHKGSSVESVITISIGLLCVDFSKESTYNLNNDKLYKMADEELYKAKNNGRNRLSIAHI